VPRVRKSWRLLPHDPVAIERLSAVLRVSPVVAQLLLNRQLLSPELAQRFLSAPLRGLYEPELLPGIVEAADRLHAAVRDRRPICIYGDYDVDGVASIAILLLVLRQLGALVEFHVPHRLEEGYGLNAEALRRLAADGISLLVTVDCGIASLAEAEEARRLGLELIISDHHEPKEDLPAAAVLVHPRLPPGSYPFGALSGSGVAFKLAWALCKRACGGDKVTPPLRECLLDAVALAALGTVADVVPLHDENRILVRHGLVRLRERPGVGLQALLRLAKLDQKPALSADDVGFALAPRLNAAGRLDTARLAVELLTTTSPERAAELASQLEELNTQRQVLERRILHEARALIDREGLHDRPALVLAGAGWHPGLIGIVAGRLAEQYGRPTLMISLHDGDLAAGSGRSAGGLALHEALAACGEHLLAHGGHAAAAGFRLRAEALAAFRERFYAVASSHFHDTPPAPRLLIDAEVPLAALTVGLAEALAKLEPYGAGNPQPLLLAGDLQIVGQPCKVGGGERHLSFRVRQQGRELKAIAFGMAEHIEELMSEGGRCCLVFTPRLNNWQGYRRVDLEVRDFQPGPEARLETGTGIGNPHSTSEQTRTR
jgi:single-stranded-DNA-specific exonuclease